MLARRLVIVEAPSTLGLASTGVEQLPEALLGVGLAERIGVQESVRVAVLPKDGTVDLETGVLNASQIALWSPRLADAVGDIIAGGGFPIVLGGDCTIVLGTMLALRRRGRFGPRFVGGRDCSQVHCLWTPSVHVLI